MREARFCAMGTTAHVVVVGGPREAMHRAERRIADLESRWSRFREDSEVSLLNRSGSARVSEDTRHLVAVAVDAWRRTQGRFDPTVHRAMVRNGYDRSFDAGLSAGVGDGGPSPGCEGIRIEDRSVTLPPGTGFDPGGIGKGLAADLVVEELLDAGIAGAMVNLGGDLRAGGESPGGSWRVAVDEPLAATNATVTFHDGGLATSTPLRRRWRDGTMDRHHLVDPDSGEPVGRSAPMLVSVVAAEAWWAEACAKAAMLLPPALAAPVLEEAAALIVHHDGRRTLLNGMERYLCT